MSRDEWQLAVSLAELQKEQAREVFLERQALYRRQRLKAESQNRAHREPQGERPGGGRGKVE